MNWQEIEGNWVLVPERPTAIIHFLGGFVVAAAPHLAYGWLLENLYRQGYVVMATPFVNVFDHEAIAHQVLDNFEHGLEYLRSHILRRRYLPIYGLGHSMGSKLHLLIGSLFPVERAGNILMSFNNFSARRSIPLLEQFSALTPALDVEFTPSPAETNRIIEKQYRIQRNLMIKFKRDDIDETRAITELLRPRFPDMISVQILPGNHTTPMGQDISWQPGESFSPADALGQFVKQGVYRDLNQLKRAILLWLDPFSSV
ncbi:MAG: DUF1350 domain-containing protein [Cyanothece sp. SIO1E1]|nr:DUF1350 domain-containing protein [Cyanothece sp. SIO1E1]